MTSLSPRVNNRYGARVVMIKPIIIIIIMKLIVDNQIITPT